MAAFAALASPAAAAPAMSSGSQAAAPKPIPAASWHGRPIRRPDRAGPATAATMRVSAGTPALRLGAGYSVPGGSARVREVQRLLLGIGYRPGTVDGMFGPLTRASVQWFQIKHSLRSTGVVDGVTLALLRVRARGGSPAAAPAPSPPPVVNTPARPAAPAGSSAHPAAPLGAPARTHKPSGSGAPVLLFVAAACLALLAAALMVGLRRRRRTSEAAGQSAEPSATPLPAPALNRNGGGAVWALGYTAGIDRRESRHHAQAIERACAERGWTLAQMVTDTRTPGRRRPGLRFALGQLEQGAGSRLVTTRLRNVGRTRGELEALLGWCARSGVELVALDVGLDTSTRAGRLSARELLARAEGRPSGLRQRARAGLTRRRRAGAPVGDGELASSPSP